jgi:hypothetical protein
MNKDDIKIKYIIGLYKGLPDYPTEEDLTHLIKKWYYLDGGKDHIHGYMKIEETDKVIFSNKHLSSILEDDDLSKSKISQLLESSVIKEFKKTAHTTYYSIETI